MREYQHPWPGAVDRIVIEEMLSNPQSEQWYECREFVKKHVQLRAKNVPQDHWDDIIQDAMIRINKFLPSFHYNCALKTWISMVVQTCIIDNHRKSKRALTSIILQDESPNENDDEEDEHESDISTANIANAAEDVFLIRNDLREAIKALQDYVSTHANSERNSRILKMTLVEGRSLEEAAGIVGCSASVAGYIVRSAQRYVRESLQERL